MLYQYIVLVFFYELKLFNTWRVIVENMRIIIYMQICRFNSRLENVVALPRHASRHLWPWFFHFVIIFGVISIFGEKPILSPTFSILEIVLGKLLEQIFNSKSPYSLFSPFWRSSNEWKCLHKITCYLCKPFSFDILWFHLHS